MTQMGVAAESEVIHSIAMMVSTEPMMGNDLYLPVLDMRRPDQMEVPIRPTIIGSINSPDSAAEVPEDICKNVGTKANAANMPIPSTKPMAVEFKKIGFLNSDSGMMGSSARDSVKMNSATEAIKPAPQVHVVREVHPSALPPKSVKKIKQVVAMERNTTPR